MRAEAEWRSEPRPFTLRQPPTPRPDASRLRPGRSDRCVLGNPQASAWSEARPSAFGYRGDPFRTK